MAERRTPAKRNHTSARAAGKKFEKDVADYLAEALDDDRITRTRAGAAIDKGDIANLRAHGQHVVVECKNTTKWAPGSWLKEAETERANDGALAGVVVAKKHGVADPAQQVVMMTLADFAALISGERPVDRDAVFVEMVRLGQELQGGAT
jgi:hypothetical protein